ncbi:hypothetical protein AAFF_G00187370 [Aldrovandia affinis]|uniref:Uncharacterized protein n=1 Tax=Aldrovandia affinis TaxID=143900 RepID=A0AAD7SXY0_9TELE|nr:hypothetical protein AAFF_G00187370 [Aldrovandia affinis]
METFSIIFSFYDKLFRTLQQKCQDIAFCLDRLADFEQKMAVKRQNFDRTYTSMCETPRGDQCPEQALPCDHRPLCEEKAT